MREKVEDAGSRVANGAEESERVYSGINRRQNRKNNAAEVIAHQRESTDGGEKRNPSRPSPKNNVSEAGHQPRGNADKNRRNILSGERIFCGGGAHVGLRKNRNDLFLHGAGCAGLAIADEYIDFSANAEFRQINSRLD